MFLDTLSALFGQEGDIQVVDISGSALGGEACPLTDRELNVLRVSRQVYTVEDIAKGWIKAVDHLYIRTNLASTTIRAVFGY